MSRPFAALQSPGLRWALLLAALYALSWGFLLFPELRLAGLPLLVWSHISVGVLAVVVSLAAVGRLEASERE